MITSTTMVYIKSILTYSTALMFVVSCLGLYLFYTSSKVREIFPREATIAKYGAMVYVIISIGITLLRVFL
jgi:hypothetical protein